MVCCFTTDLKRCIFCLQVSHVEVSQEVDVARLTPS